jgi:hypothetical protein
LHGKLARCAGVAGAILMGWPGWASAVPAPLEIRVVVVTTFEVGNDTGDEAGEFQNWVERYPLPEVLPFPQGYHPLRYNAKTQPICRRSPFFLMPAGLIFHEHSISEPAATSRSRPRAWRRRIFSRLRQRATTPAMLKRSRTPIGWAALWYASWRSIGRAIGRRCPQLSPEISRFHLQTANRPPMISRPTNQ